MRRLFKKEQASLNRFADLIDQYAERSGAVRIGSIGDRVEWKLQTPAGPMTISADRPYDGQPGPPGLFSCFCRFKDNVTAGAYIGHNGASYWSGKWNHHVGYTDFDTPDEAARWVIAGIEGMLRHMRSQQHDELHIAHVRACHERDRERQRRQDEAMARRRASGQPLLA